MDGIDPILVAMDGLEMNEEEEGEASTFDNEHNREIIYISNNVE